MSSRLSSLLVQDGLVSAAKMTDALQRQVIQGGALDTNLLETKAVDEDTLVPYLGRAASLPVQPTGIAATGLPPHEVLEVFSLDLAQRYRAIPTALKKGGVLRVLVPCDVQIAELDGLALAVQQRIEPWAVLEFRFVEALERVFGEVSPARFVRLLQRSMKAHDGRGYPPARLMDPVPRFGSLSEVRLSGEPPVPISTSPDPVVATAPVATEQTTTIGIPLDSPVPPPAGISEPSAVFVAPVQQAVVAPLAAEATTVMTTPQANEATVEMRSVVQHLVQAEQALQHAERTVEIHTAGAAEEPAIRIHPPTPATVEIAPDATVAMPVPLVPSSEPTHDPGEQPAARSDSLIKASRKDVSLSGIDELSMDEWLSASQADWLSVANKIEPVDVPSSKSPRTLEKDSKPHSALSEITAGVEPTGALGIPASSGTVTPVKVVPQATEGKRHEALQASPSSEGQKTAQEKPALVTTAAKPTEGTPSTASPFDGGKKGKKKKGGGPVPAQTATPKAAVVTPVATVLARPASVEKPAQPAVVQTVAPTQPGPVAAAPPREQPAATQQPVATPAPTAVSAPQKAPIAAVSQPVAQAPSKISTPTVRGVPAKVAASTTSAKVPLGIGAGEKKPAVSPVASPTTAAAAVATSAPAPSPAVRSGVVAEAVPERIASGRLGEKLGSEPHTQGTQTAPVSVSKTEPEAQVPLEQDLPPVSVVAESDEVPGPAPRIAVALDESGGSALSLEAAREIILAANDRDGILEALCRGVRSRAAFAAVLTLHGDVAFGRLGLGDGWLDKSLVRRISASLETPSALRTVAKGRTVYVGPLGTDAPTAGLLRALGRPAGGTGGVFPVLLRGKPVALLLIDDDGRALSRTLSDDLQPLLSEVGQAFARLLSLSRASTADDAEGSEASAALAHAAEAVPQIASEQATVPLRVDRRGNDAATAAPVSPPPSVAPAEKASKAVAEPEKAPVASRDATKSAKTEPGPKQTGKSSKQAPKTSSKSPTGAAAAPGKPTGDPGELAALLERAENQDEAAMRALLTGGEAAVQAVVAALPGPLRSGSRPALGDPLGGEASLLHSPLLALVLKMGQRAVGPIVERLRHEETPKNARFFLVCLLGEMPVPGALDALFARLFDEDEEVREAAGTALRNFPPSAALSMLRGKVRDRLDDIDDEQALTTAMEAVGALRDNLSIPQLIGLLQHNDAKISAQAGQVLQLLTKQAFGRSRFRWNGWWRRHQFESRLSWLLSGLCHGSALIRSSAQDELTEMSGDVTGYRFDMPVRPREQAAQRWSDWWEQRGFPT